ncbi:MAG: transketolase, partial [Bacteroidetes bacterium]|jgi:pyruvate/2-oxoglutarate/acetoin dehydrogenase E1 component|nr:transketolase [Bacteroidota bacterium]
MIINAIRGVHVCVPRNLTEAAGFYNTLMQGDDPALVIEPLNAYRMKEKIPTNLGEFTVPLGIPDVVQEGSDITLVSYGSTFNIVESLLPNLQEMNISAELIDARSLLPFDQNKIILESLKKTNRILFIDEDVPGGATAYMMQKVIEEHGGYYYLDSPAKCLTAKAHRPAYASDGDYFSKPNAEDILEKVYEMMHEANPSKYPAI